MQLSEERLVESAKRGKREAQRALYDLYAARLLSIIVRYVKRREVAEDILHDVFIKVFHSLDKFNYRGEGSLRAWLERVAINSALEWLRQSKRLDFTPLESELLRHNIEQEPSYEETQRIPRERLMEMISELPSGYRTVFNLYCIEEYSHREIAEQLNINEKSSSSQLLRAKRLLASKINEYLKRNGE